jgi:aarF domain-containing kinase
VKQLLYFDRYTRILAPSLQVLNDDRINIAGLPRQNYPSYN